MQHQQGIECQELLGRQSSLFKQNLAQRSAFVEHPGLHARNESVGADEVHLQGEDAKQQVAIGWGTVGRLGHG
jgi:hypothetical protein